MIAERYGSAQCQRLALQFVYEYFSRVDGPRLDPMTVDAVCGDFVAELESPVWRSCSVTNLRHFDSETLTVELGDGVSIHGRDPRVLGGLGIRASVMERLYADWDGFGASSFVLVADTTTPKHPDAFLSTGMNEGWLRLARAVGALRLAAGGDVGMCRIYVQRVARFNVGIGGTHATGTSLDVPGTPYTWRTEHLPLYRKTYDALARLERDGYGKAPGNLDLSLRAFMGTYDRWPWAPDAKLLDAITALEALLGTDSEIAFKLAFRVASLLAADDDERATLMCTIRRFYDVRSRVVHGSRLKEKHREVLASVDELRALVRRLLRCFVLFAADDARVLAKGFFQEQLDVALVHGPRRAQLRDVLGLTGQEMTRSDDDTRTPM